MSKVWFVTKAALDAGDQVVATARMVTRRDRGSADAADQFAARPPDHCSVSRRDATLATEQVRKIELARLDEMLVKVYENAVKGDLLSVDRLLAIHDPRAKMTGINAPEKIQEVGPVSDAKASLLAKLRKMAERMRPAEIAAPLKDVTPLIEHEPSADAKTESVTKSVTKPVASVTKSPTHLGDVFGDACNEACAQRLFRPEGLPARIDAQASRWIRSAIFQGVLFHGAGPCRVEKRAAHGRDLSHRRGRDRTGGDSRDVS
jgi:hypothetical protein